MDAVALRRRLQLAPFAECRIAVINELIGQDGFGPAFEDQRFGGREFEHLAGRYQWPPSLLFRSAGSRAAPAAVTLDHGSVAGQLGEKFGRLDVIAVRRERQQRFAGLHNRLIASIGRLDLSEILCDYASSDAVAWNERQHLRQQFHVPKYAELIEHQEQFPTGRRTLHARRETFYDLVEHKPQ